MIGTQHSMPRDEAKSISLVDVPSSTRVAMEAAETSASAAAAAVAASSASSIGFELINHAIRMGSGRGTPVAPPVTNVESSSEGAQHRNSDILLKAQLLDRQNRAVEIGGASMSRVSSSSSAGGPLGLHHNASDIAAAAVAQQRANLVRQHLNGGGGIVAALQRRQRQPSGLSLSELHKHLRVASYLGGQHVPTGVPATNGTTEFAPAPQGTASTSVRAAADSQQHQQQQRSQDEQNARQLNPNAFQFPWKLHDMLDRSVSEGNEEVVSWVENGEAFRVHLPDVFVENVMPRFFKQTKYKSFQRQLNLYGFTRLHNGPNKGGYKHKYFRQGQRTMCQLITRCPIRDSSSAAAVIAASVINEDVAMTDGRLSLNSSRNCSGMMVNEENSNISAPSSLPHAVSSVSISSKTSSSSLQKKSEEQLSSDAVLLSQNHHAATILAARQQQQRIEALSTSFQILEKARREQHLQQLQVQQYEAHRLQQLKLHQQKQQQKPLLTSNYAPGMPLAGTDHSAYPSITSRPLSVSQAPSLNPVPGKTTKESILTGSPHHVLDSSNTSSLTCSESNFSLVTPNPSTTKGFSEKEKLSIFHREFQFPWKLYEMLERADDDNFCNLVSWMPGNFCFKVHDAENFVKLVMPRFFKQTKYKSFQRQLNLYGFIRVDTGPNKGGYRHPSFIKGRKDLLVLINRIKIKGNGRPRSDRSSSALIVDTDGADNSSRSNGKGAKSVGVALASASVVSNPENISGIAVILEAIKAKEGKEPKATESPAVATAETSDIADSNSDNSTIPSTIDIQMKESSDSKNGNGLSWRQHPSESFSDWTIEVVDEGATEPLNVECVVYHVHRRVLAVGPKKSDFFVNLFKSSSANKTRLLLTKRQATVFPIALDYIYADTDLDLDAEEAYDKAYALYSLGERLENVSIVQTVTDFFCKWCMSKDNIVGFLELGRSFQNKTLLEAVLLKCAQAIWFMDVEAASKIDPVLLLRILVISTTVSRNRDDSEYDSLKLSQIVAGSLSNSNTIDPEIFRALTDKIILPSIEPIAAIKLLSIENTRLGRGQAGGESLVGEDLSFHERCVSSIHSHWEIVRKQLAGTTLLAHTMRSISSNMLFELLMKTSSSKTTRTGSGAVADGMEF